MHSHARACAQAKAEAAQLTEEGARQAAALCAAEAHAAELQAALGPLHLLHLCTLRTLSAPPPHRLRTPPYPMQAALDGATQREEEARAEANELVGEVQREFAAELNQLTAQSRQVRLTSS